MKHLKPTRHFLNQSDFFITYSRVNIPLFAAFCVIKTSSFYDQICDLCHKNLQFLRPNLRFVSFPFPLSFPRTRESRLQIPHQVRNDKEGENPLNPVANILFTF